MTELMGKKPRQPPIQCWDFGRDHMYWDCPHRDQKVMTVHNIQQTDIVEDMGRNVPSIYVDLDNKQDGTNPRPLGQDPRRIILNLPLSQIDFSIPPQGI